MKNVAVPRAWVQSKAREFADSRAKRFENKSSTPVTIVNDQHKGWDEMTADERESALASADDLLFATPELEFSPSPISVIGVVESGRDVAAKEPDGDAKDIGDPSC